ncbi:glutaredoxin [Candidatus Gracilibacteria bacterium]|nr:glutaredoxin [Candidatus Gracilibacteria bacterium]
MITIYSKDTCSYCHKAKILLENLKLEFIEVDLSGKQDEIIKLANMSGLRTLPQIFVGEVKKENLIGGYTDLEKLKNSGKLDEVLKKMDF